MNAAPPDPAAEQAMEQTAQARLQAGQDIQGRVEQAQRAQEMAAAMQEAAAKAPKPGKEGKTPKEPKGGGGSGLEKGSKVENAGDVSKEKACQILHDGTVHGHDLTEQQRKFFGWKCKGAGNQADDDCDEDDDECEEDRADNEANFASEQQRKFMWWAHPDIAEAWAHGEHTSDKDHKMPSGPGRSVKGPEAKAARRRKAARNAEGGAEAKSDKPAKPKKGEVQQPAAGSSQAVADVQRYAETIAPKIPTGNEAMPLTANELVLFNTYNDKWSEAARTALAEADPHAFAGPNLTFPIADNEDVQLALNLCRHAEDADAVANNIIAIARAKNLQLPRSAGTPPAPTSNKGETMTPAQAKALAANCQCQATRNALLAFANNQPPAKIKHPSNMSDDELHDHAGTVHREMADRWQQDQDGDDDNGGPPNGGPPPAENDREMHSFDSGTTSAGSQQAGGKGTKDEYPSTTDNRQRPQQQPQATANSTLAWLKKMGAPRQAIDAMTMTINAEKQGKLNLVKRILDAQGVTDNNRRNELGNFLYNSRSTEELSFEFGDLLRNAAQRQQTQAPVDPPLYFGAAGGVQNSAGMGGVPVENAEQAAELTTNWDEVWRRNASPRLLQRLSNQLPATNEAESN